MRWLHIICVLAFGAPFFGPWLEGGVVAMDRNAIPNQGRNGGNGLEDQLRREYMNMNERELPYRMELMRERIEILRATAGGYQMLSHLDNSPLERGIGSAVFYFVVYFFP